MSLVSELGPYLCKFLNIKNARFVNQTKFYQKYLLSDKFKKIFGRSFPSFSKETFFNEILFLEGRNNLSSGKVQEGIMNYLKSREDSFHEHIEVTVSQTSVGYAARLEMHIN